MNDRHFLYRRTDTPTPNPVKPDDMGTIYRPTFDPPPLKVLVAVLACDEPAYVARRRACEETWANTGLCDVRFFTAKDLNIPDRANSCKTDERGFYTSAGECLGYRVREICRWALAHGYDYVFKCDDDTYVYIDRLLKSGFQQFDYSGHVWVGITPNPFCSGGAGYWLSRKAMEVIAAQPDEKSNEPLEDVWVGDTLVKAGFRVYMDYRYRPTLPPVISPHFITVHYVKSPDQMREIHRLSCAPSSM
jgi:hypothetical protein